MNIGAPELLIILIVLGVPVAVVIGVVMAIARRGQQGPAPAMRSAMSCQKCGHPMLGGDKFCANCGQTA